MSTSVVSEADQSITVPVGITFDPCQGIREAKQKIATLRSQYGKAVSVEVVFDAQHLELVSEYTTIGKEFFDPDQLYITSQGGLLNLAILMNLLRACGTLNRWSIGEHQTTGVCPILRFKFKRPSQGTPVRQLWDALNMEGLTQRPPQNDPLLGVVEFQSRYVTPFLFVAEDQASRADVKKKRVLEHFLDWVLEIEERLGEREKMALLSTVPEIVNNIVYHGGGGLAGLSVWPSGQIEILWSNPLDRTDPPWPPSNEPQVLAESLMTSQSGGAGIKYIQEHLLKEYSGVLVVNWQTYHLVFRSGGDISIFGLQPRSDAFVPRSILFNLHLFSKEVRSRSKNSGKH